MALSQHPLQLPISQNDADRPGFKGSELLVSVLAGLVTRATRSRYVLRDPRSKVRQANSLSFEAGQVRYRVQNMHDTDDDSGFVRFAAICSCISAVTTFLMWYLARRTPAGAQFEETLQLANNFSYMARWWINFAHIFFALAAYSGAVAVLRHRSLAWGLWSLLLFGTWGLVELVGVTAAIWAVNRGWRAEYGLAGPARRELLRIFLEAWPQVWNALFFLLLIAFLFGSLSLGLLAIKGRGLERTTGILLLLAVPLSTLIMLGEYWNVKVASGLETVIYPVLQPASRMVMGVWLWKSARHLKQEGAASYAEW